MKAIRRKSERGNAMLEFALGFSLLWTLFAGLYQIGYAYYIYDRLAVATANAAQLGCNLGYDTATPSAYTTALKNMVLYGSETAGTYPVVPGLTTSNVNVDAHLDGNGYPRYVTVNITGYTINALFTSFSLPNKPGATGLYYGQVSCSTC
jgi:Flp pilus assembly protein TadG